MTRLAIALVMTGCFSSRGGDSQASCPVDSTVELGLQEDVVKLAGCPRVGGIVIRTGATINLAPLKELEEITADLSIGPTIGLDEAAFNGLLRVGGTIRVFSNGSLRGLYFPRMQQIGRVEIENNAVLTTISLPRVTAVEGALVIADNDSLELVSAPMLTTVGKELVLASNSKLNLVEISRLGSAEAVRIEGNPKVPAEVVAQLQSKSELAKPSTP